MSTGRTQATAAGRARRAGTAASRGQQRAEAEGAGAAAAAVHRDRRAPSARQPRRDNRGAPRGEGAVAAPSRAATGTASGGREGGRIQRAPAAGRQRGERDRGPREGRSGGGPGRARGPWRASATAGRGRWRRRSRRTSARSSWGRAFKEAQVAIRDARKALDKRQGGVRRRAGVDGGAARGRPSSGSRRSPRSGSSTWRRRAARSSAASASPPSRPAELSPVSPDAWYRRRLRVRGRGRMVFKSPWPSLEPYAPLSVPQTDRGDGAAAAGQDRRS